MEPGNDTLQRANGWSTARLLAIGAAAATLLGGAYGVQRVLLRVVRDQPPRWVETIGVQLVPWFAWTLLLPLLAALSRRWPVSAAGDWRGVTLHALLGVAVGVLHTAICVVPIGLISEWTVVGLPLNVGFEQLLLNRGVSGWVEYVMLTAILQAALFQQRANAEAASADLLSRQLVESELRELQMQLEPHFLFNTLGAIGAYVRVAPDVAEEMIGHLSALLRRALDRRHERTSAVRDEVALVERYLAIHSVRFGPRLTVRVTVDEEAASAVVPTLLLQPLAENAVSHGAALRPGPVSIDVSVRRDGQLLRLEVRDRAEDAASPVPSIADASSSVGIGAPARARTDYGMGVGLSNTRARLYLLYQDRHTFEISTTEEGTTVAIAIPLMTVPDA